MEDVLQETFARAFRSRGRFDPGRPIEPWLTTIAVRVAADSRARAQPEAMLVAVESEASSPDAADAYVATERGRAVVRALQSLNPRHRTLLQAVAFEGASQADMARLAGLSPDAVRAVVSRARTRFRIAFERALQEHGLAGLGGSIPPIVAKARARLLPFERQGSRPAEALAALLSAMTLFAPPVLAAPDETTMPAMAPSASTSSLVLRAAAAPEATAPGGAPESRVDVSVHAPAGSLNGSLGREGADLDTIWTLRIEPLWTEITIGTDGLRSRIGFRTETEDSTGEGGVETESCRGTTSEAMCDGTQRFEEAVESVQ